MKYTTKKCPFCKTSYVEMRTGKVYYYGSPIRTCEFCGEKFVDKEYREIALEGIHLVDTKKLSPSTIVYAVIAFLMFFSCLIAGGIYCALGILVLVYSVWTIIKEYGEYEKRMEKLKQETIASEKRLKNPFYILMLKELGYEIPDNLLQKALRVKSNDEGEIL